MFFIYSVFKYCECLFKMYLFVYLQEMTCDDVVIVIMLCYDVIVMM